MPNPFLPNMSVPGESAQPPGRASPITKIKLESTPDPETPREIEFVPEELSTEGSDIELDISTAQGRKRPVDPTLEEDSEDEWKPPPNKRGRHANKPPPPLFKATANRATGTSDIPGALEIDDSVLSKIKKCFQRAEHDGASEAEAKAAVFLARKLMSQYNVEKAEVMQYKSPEEKAKIAGSSEVTINRRDGAKIAIPIRQWVSDLAVAMGIFFDVKSYSSTLSDRLTVWWVFYGIAQNTASAALAFEKIYNLIVDWARFKKGIAKANSYCRGLAYELYRDAERAKVEEMEKAKKAEAQEVAAREKEEQLQREKELERLQPTVEDEPSPEPTENNSPGGPLDFEMAPDANSDTHSDSGSSLAIDSSEDYENESDDDEPDFVHDDDENAERNLEDTDKAIEEIVNEMNKRNSISPSPVPRQSSPQLAPPSPRPTPLSPTRESPEAEPQWKSAMQLTLFRDTASKIADDFIEARNMKLKQRRRGAQPKDVKAFNEGRRDARKIDVRQKALEDKKQEIKEEDDG